ncbi:MAG TPA: site-specific DNA-methyltransferase [Syntrophales bacterium]|nr:site-specific DNA-methyltransferase [Syntrophales bacterium]
MKKLTPNDPETRSIDGVAENIRRLKELFPELVTEGPNGAAVNVDVLKALVGDATVTDADEKYGLNWHGKRRARQLALTPSTGTLRPCPEDSVDWDTTQNLMIEGDNLEVLKLLQKSYAGKVKLIYIDPPYNTGKDFVYPDDYTDSLKNYQELTGQLEEGRRVSSNTESSGRFHTDWLNMMYPRLKLARELLRDDGIILISIDDSEFSNLRKIADEIFGEENFISAFVWNSSTAGGIRPKHVSQTHEYAAMYARNIENVGQLYAPLSPEATQQYGKSDEKGLYREKDFAWRNSSNNPTQKYGIDAPDGSKIFPGPGYIYRFVRETFDEALSEGLIVFKETTTSPLVDEYGNRSRYNIYVKKYLGDGKGAPSSIPPRGIVGLSSRGSDEVKGLFDDKQVFNNPKSLDYLSYLFEVALESETNAIILDFFAGSGTTGHAVMAQNAADGGNRQFILVQLPEPLDPAKAEQKTAADFCDSLGVPRNIAELTKERLRRAAKKIKDENPMFAGDLGFRVFKLDSSNIRAWEPDRDKLEQTLLDSVEHIKPDRTESDVLYELLLKLGLDLCVPIESRTFAGKEVHSVGGGVLMACLAPKIERAEVEALAQGIVDWHKALAPAGDTTCVFRDSAFADDVAKTNMAAILEQCGIQNVRSL